MITRILWLTVIVVVLLAVGCAKKSIEIGHMESGKGCHGKWEWCINCEFLCIEAEDWEVDREKDEERGEPGIGIEIMKPQRKKLLQP